MKGKCVEDERTWIHIGMNMKEIWKEHWAWMKMNTTINERKLMQMKGKLRRMHPNKCNTKGTWSVLPKHLKPTKQLLDPFPSLLRNGFGFMLDLQYAFFPQNPFSSDRPAKSDNHNLIATTQKMILAGAHLLITYHHKMVFIYIYMWCLIGIYRNYLGRFLWIPPIRHIVPLLIRSDHVAQFLLGCR